MNVPIDGVEGSSFSFYLVANSCSKRQEFYEIRLVPRLEEDVDVWKKRKARLKSQSDKMIREEKQ